MKDWQLFPIILQTPILKEFIWLAILKLYVANWYFVILYFLEGRTLVIR